MSLIKKYSFFFRITTALFLLFSLPLVFCEKITLMYWCNQWNHPILDLFFAQITLLGEGIFYFFILLTLFFFHLPYKKIFLGFLSFVFSSIFVQILKRIVFSDHLRPLQYISDQQMVHFVESIQLHRYYSFPSGHATTIFSCICFYIFAANIQNKVYQISLLGLAFLVAYARVYLLQHFYQDIYCGALIGVIVTTAVYHLFNTGLLNRYCHTK